MQHRDRNDEKLQAREIEFGPTLRKKTQKEHGKLYRWFDNFWYHHKWKTVACLFMAVVILVCTLQMCGKEEDGDLSVVLAGPYGFTNNEQGYSALRSQLSLHLPEDYDGDGVKRVDLVTYTIYSKEQILALKEHVDEEGNEDPIQINTATNSQEYTSYNDYLMTGESSIAFVDPWLFSELMGKADFLVDISEIYGKTPEGAVFVTDEGGVQHCFGVRLGDTKLYQNSAAMRTLPEDTVVCLITPYFMGKSSDEVEYQKVKDYFAKLIGLQ